MQKHHNLGATLIAMLLFAMLLPSATTPIHATPFSDHVSSTVAAQPFAPCFVTNASNTNAGSLRAKATDPTCSRITFDPVLANATITLTSPITINHALEIAGETKNISISGGGTTRLFAIDAPSGMVQFSNLTFKRGAATSTNGGAISVVFGSTAILTQTQFISNTSSMNGGALAIAYGGTLTMTLSTFDGNSASSGGAVANYGTLAISQGMFKRNHAQSNGGAVANIYGGKASIERSTYSDNTATVYGGAVANNGTLSVMQTTLTSNTALTGGAISNDGMITLNQATFASNQASQRGGGFSNIYGGTSTISASRFEQNKGGFYGGGISNSGSLIVSNTNIITNTALNGAGITNDGSITMTQILIHENRATGNGGGFASLYTSHATFTNATITNNIATIYGGGIANNGTLSVTKSLIKSNKATLGGGLSSDGTLTMSQTTIVTNTASNGGGMVNRSGGIANVYQSMIEQNTATNGGALVNAAAGKLNLTQTNIAQNVATNGTAGIVNEGNVAISTSTIAANSATNGSGGIANASGATTDVLQSTISGNRTTGNGGGLTNALTGTLTIRLSTISGNVANNEGGAIANSGTLTVTHSTITRNTAARGGGIANIYGASVALSVSILAQNTGLAADIHNQSVVVSQGYNLIGSNETVTTTFSITNTNHDLVGTAANPLDPKLGALQNNGGLTQTHLPLSGSPSIDAGPASSPFAYDQRGMGFPRKSGANVDIGAVEVQVVPPRYTIYLPLIQKNN